ncbi:NHLP-related RiPP peptide [Thermomonas sp.]|uniref:NHLP-related RiPP peptide n=1 Tax=Thermomonas sp. TaxID=1971895 RepID=UPI0035B4516E
MAQDRIPPAGLHPQLVKKLLDNLEDNDDFRTLFQQSPEQALRSLGYSDPWDCLQLKAGQTLASPEQIRSQRQKLEDALHTVQQFDCTLSAQAGV